MHEESISRNYAEALLALARKANAATEWATLINAVASAVEEDVTLRRFLAAPQISAAEKNAVLAKAFEGKAPPMFIKFLQKLVTNRRQVLIPKIATEYGDLLDDAEGRVHARVTRGARDERGGSGGDHEGAVARAQEDGRRAHLGEPGDPRRDRGARWRYGDGRVGASPAWGAARRG